MSWYVMALHSCRQDSLLDSLLRSDVLIIEHLEFIEGKDRTCEELFRLIRGLRAERRPVLLSADTRSGGQMPKITERLAAEFTPATVTAIDTPTLAEIEVIAGVLASRAGLEQRGDDWWRGCHNVGEIIGQMTSRAFGRGLAGCTESNSGGDAIGGTKKQ